jgi:ComF family protein
VPVHPARQRERGYNQAELIALALARHARLAVCDPLVRTRETTKQHKLDRAGRLRNLQGAFAPRPGSRVPQRVILVDDILTTSATLEACASVLREAGAKEVFGFTLAREV